MPHDSHRAAVRRSAGRASSQPSNSSSGCGFAAAILAFVLLIGAALGVSGTLGYQWYADRQNKPISVEYPEEPKFRAADDSVLLNYTDNDAIPGDVKVELTPNDKNRGGINDNPRLAFKALGTPVDIAFMNGEKDLSHEVASDKVTVTLKYNPKDIPKGLNSQQVGMAVYDEHLESWVPILNATADPSTNTVTARAPHFSWFSVFVLDPLQKTVEAAGKTIESTVNNTMTVADWLWQVVQRLTGELVKDLTGTPPELKCDATSKRVSVAVTSPLDKVKGCVQASGDSDRLKFSNGFAFPMLTDELPDGIKLEEQDVWDNGDNLPDMVRSLYWTSQNRAYISGAEISSVTVTSEMQDKRDINMDLDSEALSFDIGFAVLAFLAPQADPAKQAVKSAIQGIIKNGSINKAELDQASSWVSQSYDYADCVAGSSHDLDQHPFSNDATQDAANVAHSCLSSVFSGLNLEGALADLLSNLKVIPGVIQSALYAFSAAVLDTLPEQFESIKVKAPMATVTRIGSAPAGPTQQDKPKETPKPKPSKSEDEAAWGNFKSLIGTWHGGNGATTIVIKKDGTGTYAVSPAKCTDDYDAGTITNCTARGNIAFGPANPSIAYWGDPVAKNESGKVIPLTPDVVARWHGKASSVTLASDGRSIIFDDGPYDGLEFCTKKMLEYSKNANSPHWSRCS